jgi:hypothetical protein
MLEVGDIVEVNLNLAFGQRDHAADYGNRPGHVRLEVTR